MKSSFLLVLLICVAIDSQQLVAQHHVGIIGGLNFAELNLDPQQDGLEIITRNGFSFGAIVNINFSPIFGLQFEPSYMQKGAEARISYVEEGFSIKAEETIEAAYVDLPILFRVTIQTENVKPYLIAGLAPAFLVGDLKEVLNKITIDNIDYTNQVPANLRENEIKANGFDLGANFGGGLLIPLQNLNIFLEGQYSLGLLDINDEQPEQGYEKVKMRNMGFQAKVGVSFPLNVPPPNELTPGSAR
jgi:hypothetical protein